MTATEDLTATCTAERDGEDGALFTMETNLGVTVILKSHGLGEDFIPDVVSYTWVDEKLFTQAWVSAAFSTVVASRRAQQRMVFLRELERACSTRVDPVLAILVARELATLALAVVDEAPEAWARHGGSHPLLPV